MMAGDQRELARASKRDSTTMKAISLLGTLFLPGAYIAVSQLYISHAHHSLTLPVNLLNDFFQLSKRTRHDLSDIAPILDLLGRDDSGNDLLRRDMVYMGNSTCEEIPARRFESGARCDGSEYYIEDEAADVA